MRLVTFLTSGVSRVGAFIDGDRKIVDFAMAGAADAVPPPLFCSMQALIEAGPAALDRAREIVGTAQKTGRGVIDAKSVKLLAPLPRPQQLRDFMCFERHLIQAYGRLRRERAATAPDPEKALRELEAQGYLAIPKVWYERPCFYKPNRLTVCGSDHDVAWPPYSKTIDYELEFACVIGKTGRDIPKEKAREYIFGYTIFNDLSARDEQSVEMASSLGPGKGKDFDNSNPVGPCIATADEIPDPYALEMIVRINGAERGRGNSNEMHWKYEDCIAFVARAETVHPGELFCSGTVPNGSGLETGQYLAAGDVIELEVEKIGVLRNRIVRA
jgi:2-keto-4-pentenoate hydratase/2-oxohepta-3-ene-1,7-dioic acid hydratase in catechol pathway